MLCFEGRILWKKTNYVVKIDDIESYLFLNSIEKIYTFHNLIKIRQYKEMPKINRIPEEHKMISAGLLPAAQKFLLMQELKNKGFS